MQSIDPSDPGLPAGPAEHARHLTLKLSHRCNNHCVFCPIERKSVAHLAMPQVLEMLEHSRHLGVEELALQGGEPTIHPDVVEIIRRAKGMGFTRIFMISNGRMFSYPEFAHGCVRAGLSGVNLSIHGSTAEKHDGATGCAGSFDQVMQGLRNLVGCRTRPTSPPTVDIRYVPTRRTLFDGSDFLGLIASIDPTATVEFCYPIPDGRARKNAAEIYATQDDVALAFERLEIPPGGRVRIRNVPPCVLPERLHALLAPEELYLEGRGGLGVRGMTRRGDMLRPDACRPCSLHDRCGGVHEALLARGLFTPAPR